MDLLVLARTLSRAELKGPNLGRRIRAAVPRAEMRIQKAAAQLAELDVTEADVRALPRGSEDRHPPQAENRRRLKRLGE